MAARFDRKVWLCAVLAFAGCACGGVLSVDDTHVDAGAFDAGQHADAGGNVDAGVMYDAGTSIDGGGEDDDAGVNSEADAGTGEIDAGTGNDGGADEDAGAGETDAGDSEDAGIVETDAGVCAQVIHTVPLPGSGFDTIYSPSRVTWNHQPQMEKSGVLFDWTWFSAETFVQPTVTWESPLYPTGYGLAPAHRLIVRERVEQYVTTIDLSGVILPPADMRAFIVRTSIGVPSSELVTPRIEVVAIADAGDLGAHAAAVDREGRAVLAMHAHPPPPAISELWILTEGDAGQTIVQTGVEPAGVARQLLLLDGGALVHYVTGTYMAPRLDARSRMVLFDADYQPAADSVLDAGFCVLDHRPGDIIGAWCDTTDGLSVLRYDDVFSSPPTVFFSHDAGVTVIANIDGHLLAGIAPEELDSRAAVTLGWLDAQGFRPAASNVKLPVGFGSWTASSALISHEVPGPALQLLEVSYGPCAPP